MLEFQIQMQVWQLGYKLSCAQKDNIWDLNCSGERTNTAMK